MRGTYAIVLLVNVLLFGACSRKAQIEYDSGTRIYNVFAIRGAEIVILVKANDASSDNRLQVTIQVYKHDALMNSMTSETCGGQSGLPYFRTDDYFALLVCRSLYIYDGLSGGLGVYEDSDPYGIVFIVGDSVYREFSPGLGQRGAGTQIDIRTLKKVRDYEVEKMYLPEVFQSVDDVEMKPADLAEKKATIEKYKKLTRLKYWNEL